MLTPFGASQAACVLFPAALVYLLVRRLPRLAGFVAVAGIGTGILIFMSKALVDRARPEVGTATRPSPMPASPAATRSPAPSPTGSS